MAKYGRKAIYKSCYLFVIISFFMAFVNMSPAPARATSLTCAPIDCPAGAAIITGSHGAGAPTLMAIISMKFTELERWLTEDLDGLFRKHINPLMQETAQKLSAAGIHQAFAIGTFFDAKEQLETQRDHQRLYSAAHKDYQPSSAFCAIGTSVRSLAATEARIPQNELALARRSLGRHMGNKSLASAKDGDVDMRSRWVQFTSAYCNVNDNWLADKTGLSKVCPSAEGGARTNRDLDYTRFIDEPRTIPNINFTDSVSSKEEMDVMAMANNLYQHNLKRANPANKEDFMRWRAAQSKRSIAENSFQHIVAMKAEGAEDSAYMGAIMAALGVPDAEVFDVIGEKPSYYAQLELLSKKIAQNPTFFANLYDKPANVERVSVALRAIELMIDRSIYESRLRQEMQASALLSTRINSGFGGVSK